ncbi:hypothetical protein [Chryseobacterium indologenes]|uniref:Exo-alpha-sialidase n=1 Tax=Chryseobacterium indologenes TaxID=253 RepID=A0A0N0ZVR7_CHRID|nr:hypothetical protein [Chryseobacterium indologenes]KPE51476.1 hypothetical protein AOB46_10080 [Chryseobacterium indologenes]
MITKKYSEINVINFVPFMYKVIRANKAEEFLSFLIWEFSWRFFKKNINQIKFNNTVSDLIVHGGVNDFDAISHVKLQKNLIDFNLVIVDHYRILGSRVSSPTKLFFQDSYGNIDEGFDFGSVIDSIFMDSRKNIFVCSEGMVFRSKDLGLTFEKVLDFSSVESKFLFETITETENNELLIGEYANIEKDGKWVFVGNVYVSYNEGDTWNKFDFLKKYINKHIHILKWINQLRCLVLTEGDDKKSIWINKSSNYSSQSINEKSGWFRLNKFHIQKGGYTSLVETKENIVLGTDYYQGTNFIVSTKDFKTFNSVVIPDPYRRSAIFRMLYLENETIWASLYNHLSSNRSLLMYSEDLGKSWHKFLEYDGSKIKISMISNSIENHFYILLEDLVTNEFKTYIISH